MSVCESVPKTLAVIAHFPSAAALTVFIQSKCIGSRSAIEWSEQKLDYKVNIIIQVQLCYESTFGEEKKKDNAADNDRNKEIMH